MRRLLNDLGLLNILRRLFFSTFDQSINNKQLAKYLIDEYDGNWGQQVDRREGNLGFGFVHYGFIATNKPKRILCIGSQRGFIPAICALSCKDNGSGSVDFVDAGFEEGHPKAWSGDGFWRKFNPVWHFKKIKVDGWISTYVMTTEDFSKKYPRRKYGYIYIDGDHSYEGVKKDFDLFWPRLEKGGYMAFHDIITKGYFRRKYKLGVWKLWSKVSKRYQSVYFKNPPGLGIIQKNIICSE